MNIELLDKARTRITSVPELVNVISMRVHQLINGDPPHIKPEKDDDYVDIVLREINSGRLIVSKKLDDVDEIEG